MKILIIGGSGLVGQQLTEMLIEKGHEIVWLSRRQNLTSKVSVYYYNYDIKEIDENAFRGVEAVVHLGGFNVAKGPWSSSVRQAILDSRVKTTELIFDTLLGLKHQVKTFISASAIGYYGTFTSDVILTEESPKGQGFLSQVCYEWEQKADIFCEQNIRTVKLRTGIVLSSKGGALLPIQQPFKYRSQIVLGKGNQYFPWIHIDDLCRVYMTAIEQEQMRGVYNAVAPQDVNYKQLVEALSLYFSKSLLKVNIPEWVLKLMLGEQANMLVKGTRVSSKKLIEKGFCFQYPQLETALEDLNRKEM